MENFDLKTAQLTELDFSEMKSTDGGILPLLIIGAAILLSGCYAERRVPQPNYDK